MLLAARPPIWMSSRVCSSVQQPRLRAVLPVTHIYVKIANDAVVGLVGSDHLEPVRKGVRHNKGNPTAARPEPGRLERKMQWSFDIFRAIGPTDKLAQLDEALGPAKQFVASFVFNGEFLMNPLNDGTPKQPQMSMINGDMGRVKARYVQKLVKPYV